MKMQNKFLSLFLATVLTLSTMLSMVAYAEGGSGNAGASITVNKPANTSLSLDGQTFSAYKVFDLTTNKVNGNTAYSYVITAAFKSFNDYPGASSSFTLYDYLTGNPDAAAMTTLSTKLWAYIGTNSIATAGTATAGAGATSVTINGLDYGYYLVYGSGIARGDEVVIAACALDTTSPKVTITPKVDVPSITKEVYNHRPEIDKYTSWTDINTGDTANFKLTSKVPVMTGYSKYTFTVHDKMSPGLIFDASSVVVKVGATTIAPADYTVKTTDVGDDTFQIILNPTKFVTYTPGDDIIITYNAVLSDDLVKTVVGAPGNPNDVYLEYSNNPYSNGTGETPKTEVIVYTFDMAIYKYTMDGSTKIALDKAEFELHKDTAGGATMWFKQLSAGGANNDNPAVYVVVKEGTAGATKTLVSPACGLISIEGIDDGTYYVVETKAPDGYNKIDTPTKAVVKHLLDGDKGTGNSALYVADDSQTNQASVGIENSSGALFPSTGGIGRTIFYVVGSSLMGLALAGVLFVSIFRKKSSKVKS